MGVRFFKIMTDVGIANQALSYLGEARIQAFTQQSNAAKQAADAFEPSVRQVLRMHPWNSALAKETLSRLAGENEFGFKYSYQLPADFVKLVRFNDDVDEFEVIGKTIATNEDAVQIVYVAYPQDFSTLDSLLVEAISAKLAFNISIQVTGEIGTQARMMELYERHLARARAMDSRETSRDEQSIYEELKRDSRMIQARNRSFRFGRGPYRMLGP